MLNARQQREADRAAAAKEREDLQAMPRQVEDRAYGEVDRTRQEGKALKAQIGSQAREQAAALHANEQARRAADTALAKAKRDITALQVRLDRANPPAKLTKPKASSRTRKAADKAAARQG